MFKNGDRKKVLHFVCEPGIDESNTVIQSAIEQAKMKFNIHSKPLQESSSSKQKDEFLSESVSESLAEMVELEETMTQVLILRITYVHKNSNFKIYC